MNSESIAIGIAREALKPTSSVVDSLLAPTLARLRKWAGEQDLASRAASGRIDEAFDTYLRQLLKRVSSLTTIVFPQQVLALPDLYEPLSLVKGQLNQPQRTVEPCTLTQRSILVDGAGMGKSTFAKHRVLTEIAIGKRIPIFLELRRLPPNGTLLGAIARDLSSLDKEFPEDVLTHLLASGGFLVVLDGFDEVSVEHRAVIGNQIEDLAVKGGDNDILLTSRPGVPLPQIPDATVASISPLSLEQARSLVLRYDTASSLDIGQRLIKQFDTVPMRFLQTPLLIALLYRTFGFNNAISTREASFYDEVYNALYKGHDLTKVGFSRQKLSGLDVDDFRRLVRGLCFLMLAQQHLSFSSESGLLSVIENAQKATGVYAKTSRAFFEDLLVAVPLIVRDGSELRFIHLTLVEYFAAEFIANSLNGERLIADINKNSRARFMNAFEFLADINPSLFKQRLVKPVATAILDKLSSGARASAVALMFACKQPQVALFQGSLEDGDARGRLTRGRIWFPAFSGDQRYIIAFDFSLDTQALPSSGWHLLTTANTDQISYYDSDKEGTDVSTLVDSFEMNTWMDLLDVKPTRRDARAILEWFEMRAFSYASRSSRPVELAERALVRSNVVAFLESLQSEESSAQWISSLLERTPPAAKQKKSRKGQ